MDAEFIAIGSELVLGDLVNSNAATVGKILASLGITCRFHTAVADDLDDIASAVRIALERTDLVIISGGLGPTEDDLTREAVAAALGRDLVRDPAIEAWLRQRFAEFRRTMPERNLIQADVITGARIIDATWGTAPGQLIETGDRLIVLVPGVPAELEDMFDRVVTPELARRAGRGRIVTRTLHVAGMSESAVAEALRGVWESRPSEVAMAYLASLGGIRVRFTSRGEDEAAALARIAPIEAQAREILGDAIIGTDAVDLDHAVADGFIRRGWTLAVAESLTGGGFGERCTRMPGASDWFRGAIVAYMTDVKRSLLAVDPALIEREGVVSIAVARAMASGVRERLDATIGIGLTGVAGPGEQGRHVGTVCIAINGPGIDDAREVVLPGDRARVRQLAGTTAMAMLERTLR